MARYGLSIKTAAQAQEGAAHWVVMGIVDL